MGGAGVLAGVWLLIYAVGMVYRYVLPMVYMQHAVLCYGALHACLHKVRARLLLHVESMRDP